MTRNALTVPDEYTNALSNRLQFDLSPANLATRAGKAYIAQKAEIVSRISEGLTSDRQAFLASEYLRIKEIREAYSLYYMTTNLLKMAQPLEELLLSGSFVGESSLRILDLGTGTGAAAWGILGQLRQRVAGISQEVTLTDSLPENLHEAEVFAQHFIPSFAQRPRLRFEIYDLRKPGQIPESIKNQSPFYLITLMNVLNELDEEQDAILFETLRSLLHENGALILIEPATRIESRRLLRFRDIAVSLGATIYSPCTRQEECPALLNDNDWCHTNVPWERPPFIKAIDDIVGTLRLSLKSTYFIIRKDGKTLGNALRKEHLYRMVSERFDEKGRIRAILCGEDGRYEHIINKRDISEKNIDFEKIERYDLATIQGKEVREHDVKLLKGSEFNIVLPILGAR